MAYVVDPSNAALPGDLDEASQAAAELRSIKARMNTLLAGVFFTATGTVNAMTGVLPVLAQDLKVTCIPLGQNSITNPTLNGLVIFKKTAAGVTVPLAANDMNALYPFTFSYDLIVNAGSPGWYLYQPAGMSTIINAPVRQTVLVGHNTAGIPDALAAGAGFAVNLVATSAPLVLTGANGFDLNGQVDLCERLFADVAGIVTVPANQTTLIWRTLASAWGQTFAPPQYGNTYQKAAQACLSLNAVNIDDFGNTWTNTNVTFSNASPVLAGTYMGVFSGTNAKMSTSDITSLGSGSWTLRWKIKPSAVAGSGALLAAQSPTTFGLLLRLTTAKLVVFASSDNATWNIANGTAGTTALVNGTGYDIEVTFDAVAGKYFIYLNGVLELTIVSALKICAFASLTLGSDSAGTWYAGSMQAFEFVPYCLHPNGTTFVVPTTLTNIATAGYASEWFSTIDYRWYAVSAASAVAGTNPTFAAVSPKVYVGEVVSGTVAITSVLTYSYQGKYDSGLFAVTAAGTYTKTHGLGCQQYVYTLTLSDDATGATERMNNPALDIGSAGNYGFNAVAVSKTSITLVAGAGGVGIALTAAAATSGFARIKMKRNWD